MKVFDLHCDTLTHNPSDNPFDDSSNVLRLSSIADNVKWAQLYAIFIPDSYRGEGAVEFYEKYRNLFRAQVAKYNSKVKFCKNASDVSEAFSDSKNAAFLSVENGSVFAGNIDRIARLRNDGVRFVTLTWNGENEIASGNTTDNGMSEFGKEAVKEMEKQGIICDVSHLNDRSFEDFLNLASKPFAATHSNCRKVCSHSRNLTDEMIREMVRRNCIIGLNYYKNFLDDEPDKADPDSLLRHICHFLELGAEKNLALGSDFDGCDLLPFMQGPEDVVKYASYLVEHKIDEQIVEDIFFNNAFRFAKQNLV